MSNDSGNAIGANGFWRYLSLSTGTTAVVTCPTGYRPVITGWCIAGHNTNASAATVLVQSATANTPAFGASANATSGEFSSSMSGAWIPMEDDEDIEVVVANLTGAAYLTLMGRYLPITHPTFVDSITGSDP